MIISAIGLLATLATPASGAVPLQAGVCPSTSGVTVVVDFNELGGGVNVVCAPDSVASGLEALRAAGVSYQTTQRFPGFVCRIAGQPANDPCVNTSPASAYWTYWIAAPGGSWCYSTVGAGSRRPPPGTFEGWSFALDRTASELPPPRFEPPSPPAGSAPASLNANDCTSTPRPPPSTVPATIAPTTAVPTTAATTLPTSAPATAPQPSEVTVAPTTPAAVVVTDPAPITAAPTSAAVATSGADTEVATTDTDTDVAAGTVDLSEDGGGGGSALGFGASAAVVAGLGTAAALIARRHRAGGGA